MTKLEKKLIELGYFKNKSKKFNYGKFVNDIPIFIILGNGLDYCIPMFPDANDDDIKLAIEIARKDWKILKECEE